MQNQNRNPRVPSVAEIKRWLEEDALYHRANGIHESMRNREDGWIEQDLNAICEDCVDWGHRCHCNRPEWITDEQEVNPE